ncbi:MAG: protein kinase [Planctomycetota bacterium]|nr:protein kinase [Planctomycetota bacterium]
MQTDLTETIALLCVDQTSRWEAGEYVLVEDYYDQCPELIEDQEMLLDLIYNEIYLRDEYDQSCDRNSFRTRFPNLYDQIEFMLEIHEVIDAGSLDVAREVQQWESENSTGSLPSQPDPVQDVMQWLSKTEPLSQLPLDILLTIASESAIRVFEAGDYLGRQGDVAESLWVIQSGVVEIILHTENAQPQLISRCGPYSIIGEIGVFTREARSADMIASEEVVAIELPLELYRQVTLDFPATSALIADQVAERLGSQEIDVLTGKVLGGYRIERRLGRGSMGVVYAAHDVETDERVALKMMKHDIVFDQEATLRFKQEAEILTTLQHPRLLKMHKTFSALSTVFLVGEYCEGVTLRKILQQQGAMETRQACNVMGQLIEVLHYAHQQGIVHRDVKPANIMVNAQGEIKLMDFGLARRKLNSELTQAGQLLGSPRYMSLEQLTGGTITGKSDFFAVGCIFVELLSGKPLFQGLDLTSMLVKRLLWSLPESDEIRANLDPEIYEVLQGCLQPRAIDRLQGDFTTEDLVKRAQQWSALS